MGSETPNPSSNEPHADAVQVLGDPNEDGIRVEFAKGKWRFAPKEGAQRSLKCHLLVQDLFCCDVQLGTMVTWAKHDEDCLHRHCRACGQDIEKGHVGCVVGIRLSKGRLKVQFPKGREPAVGPLSRRLLEFQDQRDQKLSSPAWRLRHLAEGR